jgi:hypothetical protein
MVLKVFRFEYFTTPEWMKDENTILFDGIETLEELTVHTNPKLAEFYDELVTELKRRRDAKKDTVMNGVSATFKTEMTPLKKQQRHRRNLMFRPRQDKAAPKQTFTSMLIKAVAQAPPSPQPMVVEEPPPAPIRRDNPNFIHMKGATAEATVIDPIGVFKRVANFSLLMRDMIVEVMKWSRLLGNGISIFVVFQAAMEYILENNIPYHEVVFLLGAGSLAYQISPQETLNLVFRMGKDNMERRYGTALVTGAVASLYRKVVGSSPVGETDKYGNVICRANPLGPLKPNPTSTMEDAPEPTMYEKAWNIVRPPRTIPTIGFGGRFVPTKDPSLIGALTEEYLAGKIQGPVMAAGGAAFGAAAGNTITAAGVGLVQGTHSALSLVGNTILTPIHTNAYVAVNTASNWYSRSRRGDRFDY